jgi:hypothetical protein
MEGDQPAEFSPRDIFGRTLVVNLLVPAPAALDFSAPKVMTS